jgi:cytochrome c peroxidase
MQRRAFAIAALLAMAVGVGWAAGRPAPASAPASAGQHPPGVGTLVLPDGANPHPVRLVLPPRKPLSAVAQLGRELFFDPRLSGSGRMSCASCHDPGHAYAPGNARSVQLGGAHLDLPGARAVPSLEYLYRQPNFSIGPDNEENETVTLRQLIARSRGAQRVRKTAQDTQASSANLVPQGGLFWDGRANTLQQQADGPLFNPLEMDGGSPRDVARKLRHAAYAPQFVSLFGPSVLQDPRLLVGEALFALARFQIEDPSFHPFTSKFDAWLQGRARFTPSQMRGYIAFNDPRKGNCAACHVDRPTPDGLPPLFSDTQYEALGVPRNPAIPANHDPAYFDLGLCGPFRKDLATQSRYCGMFLTPTLRNVATRHAFFHNGVYHSLARVLDFYDFRDTRPQEVYPTVDGHVETFDDLPPRYRANVDHVDAPLNRRRGQAPAMSRRDMRDIISFLRTLDDGWRPGRAPGER